MKSLKLGEYIVRDPEVCHGKPTFKGTRIMVKQVLDMVAEGVAWEQIISEYDGGNQPGSDRRGSAAKT